MAEQEADPSALVCSTCGYEASSIRGLNIHITKKHPATLESIAESPPRKRTRKFCNEDVGSWAAQSEPEVGGYEYGGQDDPHPMDTSAYEGEQSTLEASLKGVNEDGDLEQEEQLYQYVENPELTASIKPFPDWSDLAFAATALALNGPVAPLDLVASGHLSREESAYSAWGQLYNVPVSGLDRLQSILTELDEHGRNKFDVGNLVKSEVQRRHVIDSQIPPHQRTARGDLFTPETCAAQLMRRNVTIEARSIVCIAVELVQQYEEHVDFDLQPHNSHGVREFNEHIGSGDRAFYLKTALHELDPDGYVILLQFHSDKTLFGSKESLWPMYLTVLNIDPNVRGLQATRHLVAFFPVLRGDWITGKNRRLGQALWHMILRWIMEPLIAQLRTGLLYKRKDGTFIRIYFRLAALTVDLPEIALLLCTYQASSSGVRPCPCCTALRLDFLKPTVAGTCPAPLRTTEHMKQLLDSGDEVTAQQFSFTMEKSAIWDVCSGTGIDAYELHDPDALHLFWSGIAKYLLTDGLVVLKRVGKESAILELDRRAKNLFRFYGFKSFQYGITDLGKLTATEIKHIMSVIYLIMDGICEDSDHSIAKVVQVMYRFHLYTTAALQRVHTAASLSELGRLGNEFLELLTASPLFTVRPSQYLFVKAHLFVCHLCLAIRNMGSLSNMDASLMESHHVMTKADGSMTTIHSRLQHIMAVQQRRLACGIYLRNSSKGVFGTSKKDAKFVPNHMIGKRVPFPMQGPVDDAVMLTLEDCSQCEWPCIQQLSHLLQPFDFSSATTVECYPTASLDHGLFVRATPSYRHEDRHDFIERLMVDQHESEYTHYDHLVALLRFCDPLTDERVELAVVEPFEEVCQLQLPRHATEKVRQRIVNARARLNSKVYDRSDGMRRLGRPYIVRDPYCQRFVMVPVETILCASHLIHDFRTTDCFYVAETTFYYR